MQEHLLFPIWRSGRRHDCSCTTYISTTTVTGRKGLRAGGVSAPASGVRTGEHVVKVDFPNCFEPDDGLRLICQQKGRSEKEAMEKACLHALAHPLPRCLYQVFAWEVPLG